jgi:hypothetical protein
MRIKRWKMMMSIAIFILMVMAPIIDNQRMGRNLKPLFVIEVARYDDGGSTLYFGPYYKVFHIKSLNPDETPPGVIDYGYHMGTWFDSLDEMKARVVEETD